MFEKDEWTQKEFYKYKNELEKEGAKVVLVDTILKPLGNMKTITYNPYEMANMPENTVFVFYCDTGKTTKERLPFYRKNFLNTDVFLYGEEEDIGVLIINHPKSINMKTYDYIIVGAGIAGCSTAYFLSKYTDSILLIDRNSDLAQGASGAAGAFLSPLLGKPNKFKDLVTKALNFSTDFYLNNIPKEITNCGVVRIPKNKEDAQKFETYKPYMDFPYEKMEDGYYFKIGSQVNSYNICSYLADKVEKLFDYEVLATEQNSDFRIINGELKAKNLILTTGADISLIKEKYFNIRAVWGQK